MVVVVVAVVAVDGSGGVVGKVTSASYKGFSQWELRQLSTIN